MLTGPTLLGEIYLIFHQVGMVLALYQTLHILMVHLVRLSILLGAAELKEQPWVFLVDLHPEPWLDGLSNFLEVKAILGATAKLVHVKRHFMLILWAAPMIK